MSTVIDIKTRRRVDTPLPASIEIIDLDDASPLVLFDGLCPRELAHQIRDMIETHNRKAS